MGKLSKIRFEFRFFAIRAFSRMPVVVVVNLKSNRCKTSLTKGTFIGWRNLCLTSYLFSYFRAGFYAIMAHCYASLCTLHCANLCGRTTQSFPSKLIPPIKNQSAVFLTFLDQSKGSQKDSQTLSTNPSSKVPPKCPPPLSAPCRDVVKI